MSERVAVDWSAVNSSTSRAALHDLLEGMGRAPLPQEAFWPAMSAKKRLPEHMLVITDLANCVRRFRAVGPHLWASAIRQSLPYILVLVRTQADKSHAALVDDLVQASANRLTVCDFTPSHKTRLVPCLSRALAAGEDTSVVNATYSKEENSLWVEFGDGLRAAIRWADLDIDAETYGLFLDTATVSEDLASVEVFQADGGVFDVDAGVLRMMADKKYAAEVGRRAKESRASVGARVRVKRETAGLTQANVANRSGLDQALISKLERGKHRPRLDTLTRYANALGLSVSALLSDS